MNSYYVFFFFFQAEDGIRVGHVTGVQTCALPISSATSRAGSRPTGGVRAGPESSERRLAQAAVYGGPSGSWAPIGHIRAVGPPIELAESVTIRARAVARIPYPTFAGLRPTPSRRSDPDRRLRS